MSKDNKIPPKPVYQPVNHLVVKRAQPGVVSGLAKQSSAQSLLRSLTSPSPAANEQNRAAGELSIDPISASTDRTAPDIAGLNIQKLQDRISACLAMQAAIPGAWAVSMPLRNELAPLSRMRLESDRNGELTLKLFSELPAVVEAMKSGIPALKSALRPWSSGVPTVEVTHDDSVQRF